MTAPISSSRAAAAPTAVAPVPLEPTTKRPGPNPWKATPGGIAGIVAGGALPGALVGWMGGSLLGLAITHDTKAIWPLYAAMTVGAVAGAAGGAAIGHHQATVWNRDHEEQRIDASWGRPTLDLSKQLIGYFDQSGDGKISLHPTTNQLTDDERVTAVSQKFTPVAERHFFERQLGFTDVGDGMVTTWSDEGDAVSESELFTAADQAGDADGTLTSTELATYLATNLDHDGSGTLTTPELQSYTKDHPLQVTWKGYPKY